ncbi:cullin-5-like isoform X2 [Stegodyphus dumicola]|uniref:cullin-5-like isoform X2 n=1 Tax=Stegodyphus dumicola TaxID=202533 RepID=UPI0015AF0CD6|nr:cullin-5-like isoform X2 [Stegodyphus dumicola]
MKFISLIAILIYFICFYCFLQDSEKYVAQLLELFRRFSKLVKESFINDPRFLASRDKAFKKIVNDISVFSLELPTKKRTGKTEPESRCPELLANYCDMLLRKTPLSKKLTSDEIEGKLKDVLLILKYVQNKDVFMRYHKSHLTRRLILETSADNEKEENMVNGLRDIGMPADYVNKLSRMFQDIKVNEDLNEEFKGTYHTKNSLADLVKIKILNTGAWARASERIPVSLPLELEDFIPEVEEFYKQKYSGRKLQWYHHMSNGTSLVAFPKLKRQVLLYSPEVKTPKDFDESTSAFWINQKFAIIKNNKPQTRGKINLIGRLQLSTEKSKQEDNECIVHLRILRTQEAIVKILKMRKRVTNAQLQTELVEILKNLFLPSRKMMKEQIEWLIEHKYMKRDDDDIRVFHYMA